MADSPQSNPMAGNERPRWRMLWFGLNAISKRRWTSGLLRTLTLILITGVGVGAFFSIRLANKAALMGFEWFSDSISGESPLTVQAAAGKMPVSSLRSLRQRTGTMPVHFLPILETTAIDTAGVPVDGDLFSAPQFQLIGMDVTALANLTYLKPAEKFRFQAPPTPDSDSDSNSAGSVNTGQSIPEIYIPAKLAEKRQWSPGNQIEVIVNDARTTLRIAAILPENDFLPEPPANLMLMDLPDLQALLNDFRFIDRVEVQVAESGDDQSTMDLITHVRQALEAGPEDAWVILDQSSRKNSALQMTQGFRLNLSILSLLALIVGIYLTFQSLEASVSRRRTEAAVLKSLGWRGSDIRALWLVEALFLGIAGSLAGIGLGFAGAQAAVGGIARTVNSLYYSNSVAAAGFDWPEASMAMVIGIAACLIAAWIPAGQISRTPPAHQLGRAPSSGALVRSSRLAIAGIALALSGFVFSLLPPWQSGLSRNFPVGGYFSALIWLMAMGMMVTGIIPFIARFLKSLAPDSVALNLASSQLIRPTSHHFWAIAGLVAAVGMAAGMGILIASFETTIVKWMNQILRADVYIASSGISNASSQNRIPSSTWQSIANHPSVSRIDRGHLHKILFEDRTIWVIGAAPGLLQDDKSTIWVVPPDQNEIQRLLDFEDTPENSSSLGSTVVLPAVVTETFVMASGYSVGDTISLSTPTGPVTAEILGVYADYGSELGTVAIPMNSVTTRFLSDSALNLAVYLNESTPAESEAFADYIRSQHPGLVVRLNQQIREEALTIFHQTFAVTYALQVIGLVVAVAGLALALVSLWLERMPQIRTWKELGITRAMAATTGTAEGIILTAIGTCGGLILSLGLGWLLVYVINRQSFGWTLNFSVPWAPMLIFAILMTVAGAIVSAMIGRWSFNHSRFSDHE